MKTTITFCVWHKPIALIIKLTAVRKIFLCTLCKVVLIHKVISRVIRRIYVNHFNFAEISFLQEFEDFEVVALDIKIFGIKATRCTVLTHTFFPARTQGFIDGGICKQNRLFLVRPGKLIAFFLAVHHVSVDLLHQHILINRTNHYTVLIDGLGHSIWEQLC